MTKWRLSVLFLFITAYSSSASAQGLSLKALELNMNVGMSVYTNKTFQINYPQALPSVTGKMQFSTNHRFDARANFLTTKRFGMEAFYSLENKNSVVFTSTSSPAAPDVPIPLQIHHFGLNLLYYPTGKANSALRPYVYLGGGAMIYRPSAAGQAIATNPLDGDFSKFIESSRPAVTVGAGVKRTISKTFGLRLDVADVVTVAPTFGLPRVDVLVTDVNASVLPVYGWEHNLQATVGFIFYLGR
jgi:opacity protein-like surface antigen